MAHEGAKITFGTVVNPDAEDEVKITVIATGFDEKKEKVELPQVKKWAPVREPLSYRGSERVLAKNLVPKNISFDSLGEGSHLIPYEDPLDVPTFLRNAPQRTM
jgi:cell division protein FtsZ